MIRLKPYKHFLTALFFIISYCTMLAQSLPETLRELAAKLPQMEDEKNTYRQQLTFDEANPYRIVYTTTEIAKKDGKEKVERFEANLADFDRIEREATKSLLSVELKARKQLKAIKYFEDGKQENYRNEFFIRAKDSENSDDIARLLRQALPLAEELWEASFQISLNDLPAMLGWLQQNIRTVSIPDIRYEQVFEGDGRADLVRLKTSAVGEKRSETYIRHFSLADLAEQSVVFNIQGTEVRVEANTERKVKLIKVLENNEKQDYEGSLEIQCKDPDEAKRIAQVLRKAIPLAKATLQQALPAPNNRQDALAWLTKNIKSVSLEKGSIEQSLSGDCSATFKASRTDDTKQQTSKYAFYFGDLNRGKIEWEIKGPDISLSLTTNEKRKYIQHEEDGELQHYVSSFEIAVPDVETARFMEIYLAYIIADCVENIVPEDMAWLSKQAENIKKTNPDLTQEFSQPVPDNGCKYSLRLNNSGKKEAINELYEFNLKDMDVNKIKLNVSGKTITVELAVRGREKLINYYKNDKPSYVDKVEFQVTGIPEAKVFVATLKRLTDGCK